MNAKTLEAITRHGRSLLEAFPNATEQNPVALCKKLRRIEVALSKTLVDYCNGENGVTTDKLDIICYKALDRVTALLGGYRGFCGLFVNRDPRGNALKFSGKWTREYNQKQYEKTTDRMPIYTDMGGYGILAPDLNTK